MINETVDFVNINTGSYGHEKGKPFITTSTTIDDLVRLIENSKTIGDRNSNKQSLHNIIDKNKEYHFYIDLDKKTSLGFNNICSHIFKYFKNIHSGLTLEDLKYSQNKSEEFSYHIEIPKIFATPPVIKSHIEEIETMFNWEDNTWDKSVYGGKDKYRLPYQPKPKSPNTREGDKGFKYNPNSMHEIIKGDPIDFILAYIPDDATRLVAPNKDTLPTDKKEKKLYGKEDLIKKLLDCLSPSRCTNWDDWIKIMFIVINELGISGENVFIDFCNKVESYKEKESDNRYRYYNECTKSLSKELKQKATIASLINMAKEDNLELYNKLTEKIIYMKSIEEGATKFCSLNKKDLVCGGNYGVFCKLDNLWVRVYKNSDELKNFVRTYKIFKIDDETNKCTPVLTDYDRITKFANMVYLEVIKNPNTTFYDKLHKSMIGKVAFKDGIYDVEDKQFYKYGHQKLDNVYPFKRVEYSYNGYTPSYTKIREVEDGIFKAIFGEDYIKAINFIGRATFGYYKDKDWGKFIGNRNCGKGVLCQYLGHVLQSYIGTISGDKLLYERTSTKEKDTKENAWLIDFEFKRFMLINEFKFCANNKNIKVDGVKIKGIASGGDMWRGRKNFQDDVEFFIEAKPIIFANDMPPVEPVDTLTTCIEFNTTKQFISEAAYYEKHENNINMDKYVIEDNEIKNKISTDDYIYSFWKILEKHFENKKLQPAFQVFEEDGITLEEYIEKNYIITKDPKDRIPLKSIKLDISNPLYNFSIGKVKTEFIKTYGAKEHRYNDGVYLLGVKFKNSQNLNTDYDDDNEI
jgi:hypothetical protein